MNHHGQVLKRLLLDQGAYIHPELSIHDFHDGAGRGIVTSSQLRKGDKLIELPSVLTWSRTSAQQALGSNVLHPRMSLNDTLALYLLHYRCKLKSVQSNADELYKGRMD